MGHLTQCGKKIHISHIYIVISFVEKNGIENNLEKFIYCTLNSTHCCKANFVKKTHSVWICMSSELGHNTLPFFSVIFISMTWNEKMSSKLTLNACFFPHFYFSFFSISHLNREFEMISFYFAAIFPPYKKVVAAKSSKSVHLLVYACFGGHFDVLTLMHDHFDL